MASRGNAGVLRVQSRAEVQASQEAGKGGKAVLETAGASRGWLCKMIGAEGDEVITELLCFP